jgi:hypothetical protein
MRKQISKALWLYPVRGVREIPLETGAQGILFSTCAGRGTRRSSDGRWPVDNVNEYFNVAVYQVRASNKGSQSLNSQPQTPAPRVLDADELTILTGWAQALAYDPECVEVLLADAQAGAPWRAKFGIAEPPQQLNEAIHLMSQTVRAVAPPQGGPTLDALLISCQEDRPAEQGLKRLVRRVLRSTLEQLRIRQATEVRCQPEA